jgi:hypothetical protein
MSTGRAGALAAFRGTRVVRRSSLVEPGMFA